MIEVPKSFMDVSYESSRIPGVENQADLTLGANCQVYIYALLNHFGKNIPNFRSSELWDDIVFTKKVSDFHALDIMMYNDSVNAYGAHVGLYLGDQRVVHLSKDNGIPKVELHDELIKQRKYSVFIGAKRIL